jgi:glutamine synthetase
MSEMTNEEIVAELKSSDVQKVRVAIVDIDGVLRGKVMHKDKFLSAVDGGFGFCTVVFGWDCADLCYDHVDYTGWHTGYPDAEVEVDLQTYRTIPWEDGVPFFLGHFVKDGGKPLEVCPRQVLRQVVEKSEAAGYKPLFGTEFEWFNFKETPQSLHDKSFTNLAPITPGMFGYSILRSSMNSGFFSALMDDLLAFGVPVEGLHTETGPGVYEAAILYSDALEAADRAVLFKTGAKEIAYRFGIVPTFMAKWHVDLPGSSGHMHQSLQGPGGKNLFYEGSDPMKMSDVFRSYLAGQMLLLPELLPFYAPTINSYKRLVEGAWAPTRVTWSGDNRTASLRVISGGEKSTRLETRVTGADFNPYLGIAAALASGLYGVQNNLKLEDAPVVGNAYEAHDAVRLPGNLYDAAVKMKESKIAREIFGDGFIDHFATTRIWEWRQFQKAVTDWELKRYFEII